MIKKDAKRQPAATDMSAGHVGEVSQPGPEHKLLEAIIGKWINEGRTMSGEDAPALKITASDVYQWAPGGFFVLHSAYGRIGDAGVGAVEVIGYDPASKQYRCWFFDNQGNTEQQELTLRGDTWTWTGDKTRCIARISADGNVMTAHHERAERGGSWVPSMETTLTRVE